MSSISLALIWVFCAKSLSRVEMAKTRKQRAGSLASFFKRNKKAPVSTASNMKTTKNNTTVMYGRKQSLANFVTLKQKKADMAKKLRNHAKHLKTISNATRNEALRLMNTNMRNKTRTLINYKNLNSLSNDQLIELYTTGKVRSLSV